MLFTEIPLIDYQLCLDRAREDLRYFVTKLTDRIKLKVSRIIISHFPLITAYSFLQGRTLKTNNILNFT